MDNVTHKIAFTRTQSGLVPTSPRSLNDLRQTAVREKAAALAESVEKEGLAVDSFIKGFEGKPEDTNLDFPGHVTVTDVSYGENKLTGGTVKASHHPRELDGTKATVSRPRFLWFAEKTDYRVEGGGKISRTKNNITETVSEKNDFTYLAVSGRPNSHEVLNSRSASDFPRFNGVPTTFYHFKLDSERHFDEAEPWHNTDTSRITDPQKAADRAAARDANQAIQKNMEVFNQAMALDQTPADLNTRPGEVLLQNASLGDRVVSGSVRPMYTRNGDTADNPDAGSYFPDQNNPYMHMHSENTGETFEAFFGKVFQFEGDYSDNAASEMFVYSTPERSVKARIGERRNWYSEKEAGWSPHYEDDSDYPMQHDYMGGSIILRSKSERS